MRKGMVLLSCLVFGIVRLGLYWVVEAGLRGLHTSESTADITHSMISTFLFCVVGWLAWQFSAHRAVQKFIDDQVRNGLQIVRYLEALETDPAKRAALRAVDVKFAGPEGHSPADRRWQLFSTIRAR